MLSNIIHSKMRTQQQQLSEGVLWVRRNHIDMNKKVKLFIVYFPVLLISCQVLVDLLAIINQPLYLKWGFYLNTFFGTNVLFAVFLLAFTLMFRFCRISVWAAVAECAFALYY